jgi:xanthosine utilization system XapX-like protein
MLIGEQVVPLTSKLIKGEAITATWFSKECMPKITGTPDSSVAPDSKIASRTTDQ